MFAPSRNRFKPLMTANVTKTVSTIQLALAAMFALSFIDTAMAQWEVEYDRDKPHHFSIVTAGTHIVEGDENHTAFTIGGDYEYRINRLLGLGFVIEHAFGEVDATTLLAVTDIHIWRGLAIQAGPGVEFTEGETSAAGRIGALYEFELENGYTVSPQLHYDISAENSLVFGFSFGKAF